MGKNGVISCHDGVVIKIKADLIPPRGGGIGYIQVNIDVKDKKHRADAVFANYHDDLKSVSDEFDATLKRLLPLSRDNHWPVSVFLDGGALPSALLSALRAQVDVALEDFPSAVVCDKGSEVEIKL